MKRRSSLRALFVGVCLATIAWSIGSVVFDPKQHFFTPYYTETVYQQLERLYNQSQYRLKHPLSFIPDEIVFRYAAGAYLRGVDPILVNSEHTPLGKYLIGLSYLLFQNDGVVIVLFLLLSLLALWLLGWRVLGDWVTALIPVALFSTEELLRNQLRVTPLLDIMQLPFVLFALVLFLHEYRRGRFLWTSISLGMVAATKSVVPALLLVLTFGVFLLIRNEWKKGVTLVPWLFISLGIFMLSYTRTFLNGYSFLDFLGFQKWILLYQQSKLIYPFSFWRLMFFNQWQTWWGDMGVVPAVDWNILWPMLVTVPFLLITLGVNKKNRLNDTAVLLLLWVFVYEAFLSLGVVVTRFLLPLLPVLYILGVLLVQLFLKRRFRT